MNIQSLFSHTRLYIRSEAVVAEIWLKLFARKFALVSIAILAGLMGLAFVNVALYVFLTSIWGPVWTPLAVGIGNFALAIAALVASMNARPSSELALAEEVRKLCGNSLEAEFQSTGPANGTSYGADSASLYRLLIPAIISIVGAVGRRKVAPKK